MTEKNIVRTYLTRIDIFLLLSFLAGVLPAIFVIHLMQKDFVGYYFLAMSFLDYHGHAYQFIPFVCSAVNTGLNARAPLVPFLMAASMGILGKNLLSLYLPFFLARILIVPLTYLVGRYFLPPRLAFFGAVLLVFIPKLQTYAFGSLEADIFVALFYVAAMYCYLKSNNLRNRKFALLTGFCLGLGALTKSIGLAIGIGFVLAVFLSIFTLKIGKQRGNLLFTLLTFILVIGPYLLWTLLVHKQLYITTQFDKSLGYIFTNLPSLLYTIPIYLGIDFSLGLKGKIVSFFLLVILLLGIVKTLWRKDLLLILPSLIALILISTLSTCLIGENVPGNYEFITILGFTMIPALTLFFIGVWSICQFVMQKISLLARFDLFLVMFTLILLFKFTNNFFTVRYALDFIPGEYYLNLFTIMSHNQELPQPTFTIENGKRLFKGPNIKGLISKQYYKFRSPPFSPLYVNLLLGFLIISVIVFLGNRIGHKGS